MLLFSSFFIFAFAGSGRCGAVSLWSGKLEHFLDSADDTTHLVVFFRACIPTSALLEQQIGQLFLGENKLVPLSVAKRVAYQRD